MVWQRFAKSPRSARAGSTPVASANSWTCSSAEPERDCAKVEVARSNRARSTNYGVAESERRESLKLVYVGSNPTSVANILTRVVQLAGDDRFRLCTVWVRIPPRVPMGMNAKWKAD
jgi:hypothetical protein